MILGLLILSVCILWPLSICFGTWLLGLPKQLRFQKLVRETVLMAPSPFFTKAELQELMQAVEKDEPSDHDLLEQLQEMWYV